MPQRKTAIPPKASSRAVRPGDSEVKAGPQAKVGEAVASGRIEADPLSMQNVSAGARRVVRSRDILQAQSAIPKETLWQSRRQASARFRLELSQAKVHFDQMAQLMKPRHLPASLIGRLVHPNGSRAARIQVEAALEAKRYATTITNNEGDFTLLLPTDQEFPDKGLVLSLKGANKTLTITLKKEDVSSNGLAGTILLPGLLEPLPLSLVGQLEALIPSESGTGTTAPGEGGPAETPSLAMGEDGGGLIYKTNTAVDRFPYSVFIRLIEPRTSILNPVLHFGAPTGDFYFPSTDYFPLSENNDVNVSYVDRVPVDQPISVDGFKDQLVGVGDGQTVGSYETVAMAGTLGLGYLVNMAQSWTPKGLTLGNLVYSLPLAPGEQQRVAIFERRDTSLVKEGESFETEENAAFSQDTDASTEATFSSAFSEVEAGGSSFSSSSKSGGGGWSIIIASGGGGHSSSSGSSSSWLQGQRDYASRAAENVHTSVDRAASARRRASRTSMRLAMASESMALTTKVITNHNHTRAMTMQYWEVQRLYDVSSTVEGVSLVCLVPLQVVRFLPSGQRLTLASPSAVDSRAEILTRYAQVLKHTDVLQRALPRAFQFGLTLLRQFAADPTATFAPVTGAAQDVIHFQLTGTYLPFEEIYVSAVTKRGTRLGPVRLTGIIAVVPEVQGDLEHSFPTQDALMGYLRDRRATTSCTLSGDMAVPPALARNEIVGFEVTRRFRPFDYDLVNPAAQAWNYVVSLWTGTEPPPSPPDHMTQGTVRLSPRILEEELGGPFVWAFNAKIHPQGGGGEESYASDYLASGSQHQLPPGAFPIPAFQLAPVLRYTQLLEIEKMVQHVVQNTVKYSKAVWQSVTPEERAIMLEGFTIGVPEGGITDESQDVPLLNCIENRVLGFFGNSMIMPFFIPRQVADVLQINNAQIQNTLMEFHKTGFTPKKSTIALPTRGVLGEAVLGSSPSAERIDITRFWNWADSPSDTAPEIAAIQLPTTQSSLVSGMQGPSGLTSLQPMINNINATPTVPGADGALLQAMAKVAAEQKGFDTSLTGVEQLAKLILGDQSNANSARADALKTTRDLSAQTIATAGNLIGGKMGNPTAGSTAASAVYGTKGDAAAAKPADAAATKPATTPAATPGTTPTPTPGGGTNP